MSKQRQIKKARGKGEVPSPATPAGQADETAVEGLKQRAQGQVFARLEPGKDEVASFADELRGIPSEATALEAVREIGQSYGEKAIPLLENLAAGYDTSHPSQRIGAGHDRTLQMQSVKLLGTVKSEAAVRALARIADTTSDRDVRKEAKRSIFRLRSAGLDVESVLQPERPEPTRPEQRVPVVWRSFASTFDAAGDRLFVVAVEKPFGGIESCFAVINEIKGIEGFSCRDTNKRKWEREEMRQYQEDWKPMRVVEIPPDYARHLFKVAYEKNKAAGEGIPPEFARLRPVLAQPEREYERPIIYDEINPLEIKWDPELLEESPGLLGLPEFQIWHLPERELFEFVQELAQIETGQIALPQWVEKEKEQAVINRGLEKLLTPEKRDSYKRQLEETAYILLRTERLRWAKVAVAAALAMEGAAPPQLAQQPFIKALVAKSIKRVLEFGPGGERTTPPSELMVEPEQLARFIHSNLIRSK